jgi:hypothetical protein
LIDLNLGRLFFGRSRSTRSHAPATGAAKRLRPWVTVVAARRAQPIRKGFRERNKGELLSLFIRNDERVERYLRTSPNALGAYFPGAADRESAGLTEISNIVPFLIPDEAGAFLHVKVEAGHDWQRGWLCRVADPA